MFCSRWIDRLENYICELSSLNIRNQQKRIYHKKKKN